MKTLFLICCLFFVVSNALADREVYLSLDKTQEKIETLSVSATVIKRREIEESRVETLGELLANETSIFYGNYGPGIKSSFISLRGAASSSRVLVLIDGRRIYTLDSNSANLAAIPVSNIERVEIIRGAAATIYGTGAFGGVINVITKKADYKTPLLSGNFSYGSFNTYSTDITGSYKTNKFAILALISSLRSDGYRKNSEYVGYNAFFSGQGDIGDKSKFSIAGSYYTNKFGLPGVETDVIQPNLTAEDINVSKYAKIDYDLNISEDSSLKISGYASGDIYEDKEDRRADYYYKNISETYGLQSLFHFNDIFLLGIETWQDKYKNKKFLSGDFYDSSYNRTQDNYAAYAQLNYSLGKFNFVPGARGTHNSKFGSIFTPSLAVIYGVDDNIKLSGTTGKVWRAPTFIDLYYPGWSNPNLKPEKGISSDLGIEYSKTKTRLSVTGYYITTNDLIVSLKNVGKTKQYGVEFETSYIFSSKAQCKANYTYLEAKDITDKTDEKTLKYAPKHSINCTLTFKPIDKLNLSVIATYKDRYIGTKAGSYTGESVNMSSYITLDLNLSYELNDNFSFWVKVFNITDSKYQIVDGYPMPGVAVYGSVGVKLWK
ncbi:MAG: TonB-dependent receptor [Endomicrobium sp.]|jgi:outer membrane cobalamin receptor|nr:TonB-dependent receptor [Endomicrobium sp.]